MKTLVGTARSATFTTRFLVSGICTAVLLIAATAALAQDANSPDQPQADPPSQVARISVLQGNVSVEPASVDQFSAAEANYPLTTGDRIYADADATAELQAGQLAVRLGPQTDLTVTAMTDVLAQLGLASGSVHLRSFALDPNATLELDTPNVAVTVLQPGDVRVDVDPQTNTTVITLVSGQVQVDGNGLQQVLEPGQAVRLGGSDPVSAQWMYAAAQDNLDRFSANRDAEYQAALSNEEQYTNPDMIGAEDLSANGDWETGEDDTPAWYPGGVSVDWQPYSCGRWAWVAPWGWTWVECEPWGFAPFHYGRWERRHTPRGFRWGWIPGPPVVRPIYSPALVVFVGGGSGVTAWFPLGPRETYVPWYHATPFYLNRVNVSNIYDRNTVQVRNIYNTRVTNVYKTTTIVNNVYINRQTATVAVPQNVFAGGRPVAKTEIRLTPQQLTTAPVLPHPLVTPERTMVVTSPARAVPATRARPTLTSHVDTTVRPGTTRLQPIQQPGNPRIGTPAQPSQPAPVSRQPTVAPRPAPVQTPSRPQTTIMPANPPARLPVQTPAPGRQVERTDMPATTAAPRPLFNKAVPPEPRPSFELQQKAIETTDPGRPLSPQQLNNLKQNQPVGRPEQPEKSHPAAAPRAAAPAERSSPPPPAPAKPH
jgi:hypothetical protein